MKWLVRAFFLIVLLALAGVAGAYYLFDKLITPANPEAKAPVIFEVRQGMLGGEVAHELAAQGLIKDEFAFRMLLRFHPKGKNMRVGIYSLSPAETPWKLFEQLQTAKSLTRKATFPEGLVIHQVAEIAHKSNLIKDPARFRQMAFHDGKSFGEMFPANLEGYLLPDTYEFPYKCDEQVVLQRFTDEFRSHVEPLWAKYKAKSPLQDLNQVVILASLVERESQVDGERPLIAGVYINRIRKGMRLECDATIQYALGKQKPILTFEDLKIDSPYNTYRVEGLPPGPIANPGIRSLKAAMAPTPSKFFFYVRNDIKNDGSHVFGKTYDEHIANCNRYQR
ncbi:endolytic transglycosylase MltG [bacterium]|nr:endolytic transglycosylase MltG [bacterium]